MNLYLITDWKSELLPASSFSQQVPGKPLATVAPSRPSPAPLPAPLSEDEAKAVVTHAKSGDEEANALMHACCLLALNGKYGEAAETMKEKDSAALVTLAQKYYNDSRVQVLARAYLEEPRLIRECQKQKQRAMTTENFDKAALWAQEVKNLKNLMVMYAIGDLLARNIIATTLIVSFIIAKTEARRNEIFQCAQQLQTALNYAAQFAIESVIKLYTAQKGPEILEAIKQAPPGTHVNDLLEVA